MGVEYFRVHFDNPYATFYCGETVTGHVALKLTKEKRLRAIEIKFLGKGEVRWSEHHTRGTGKRARRSTTTYSSEEIYMDNTVCVLGGNDAVVTLPSGEYTYHFTILLPQTLPSTFEGTKGHVRYTIKAKIVRPWRFNEESKVAYTVLNVLDLNNVPNIQAPITASEEKTMCCWFCRSDPIVLVASLPFSGFVPGQRVPLVLEVDNQSSSQLKVNCNLVQKVSFTGTSYSGFRTKTLEARSVIENEQFGVVNQKSSQNFQSSLVIPPLPASFLVNCNCIDIAYFMEIVGEIPGMHIDAILKVPIVIGMMPLRNHFQSIVASDYQVPSTSVAAAVHVFPSAPPGYDYPELAPPSYEECVSGKADIRSDDDSKDLQGSTEFIPRYPVYRFQ